MTNDPVHLTRADLARLRSLIESGQERRFYDWGKWQIERDFVLRFDRHECQICRARGRYRRAVIVHHVKHLTDRPDLALSMWDTDDPKKRQLLSVCKPCHEAEHPEWQRPMQAAPRFTTDERWD